MKIRYPLILTILLSNQLFSCVGKKPMHSDLIISDSPINVVSVAINNRPMRQIVDSTIYYLIKEIDFSHLRDSFEIAYLSSGDDRLRVKGNSCVDSVHKYYSLLHKFSVK